VEILSKLISKLAMEEEEEEAAVMIMILDELR
jgi:hypothetical protein